MQHGMCVCVSSYPSCVPQYYTLPWKANESLGICYANFRNIYQRARELFWRCSSPSACRSRHDANDVTLNPDYITSVMCDVQQAQMSGQNINLVSSICSHIFLFFFFLFFKRVKYIQMPYKSKRNTEKPI